MLDIVVTTIGFTAFGQNLRLWQSQAGIIDRDSASSSSTCILPVISGISTLSINVSCTGYSSGIN